MTYCSGYVHVLAEISENKQRIYWYEILRGLCFDRDLLRKNYVGFLAHATAADACLELIELAFETNKLPIG